MTAVILLILTFFTLPIGISESQPLLIAIPFIGLVSAILFEGGN